MNHDETLDPGAAAGSAQSNSSAWAGTATAIFWAGLLAGTLDIAAAMINSNLTSGSPPTKVLLGIASGVFRQRAFAGGWEMPAAGLFFHFVVSYAFATLFFLVHPRVRLLGKRPIIAAILFCAVVWSVMNLVVLPVTFGRPFHFDLKGFSRGFPILVVCFGLPISLLARRYYRRHV